MHTARNSFTSPFRDLVTAVMAAATTALFILLYTPASLADVRFLRTADDLEDPRGYCLDVQGFGPSLRLEAPIATHTCKYSLPGFYIDQLFEFTDRQQLLLVEYNRCLAAKEIRAGARVHPMACDNESAHGWLLHENGHVTPSTAGDLCLTVSAEKEFVNTLVLVIPAYSTRTVSLEACSQADTYRQKWRLSEPNEQLTYSANTLRSGMPAEIAAGLQELGKVIDPPATQEIYSAQPRLFKPADVVVSDRIRYGTHPRHLLQVYTGKHRRFPRPVTVLMLVHGGGYTRGDLSGLAHAATHFAGMGLVVVNITYPLAPSERWPAGAESIAAALKWVKRNIAGYNGNPDQVFLLGHSAGGNHVASYAFRPDLLPADTPEAAGVILASAPLRLAAEETTDNELAYFGEDTGDWPERQIPGNIVRTSIPVLAVVAELDPDRFHRDAAELHYLLTGNYRVRSRLRQLPGHNHVSYITAIGTADRLFEEVLLDFISP